MTLDELKEKMAQLKTEANQRENDAIQKYCESIREYGIGDLVEDQCGIIKVESWDFIRGSMSFDPDIIYKGPQHKKSDLKPFKNGDRGYAYQSNVVKKHEVKS